VVSGILESLNFAAAHLGGAVKAILPKNNGEKYIKDAGLQYGVTWKHLEDMITSIVANVSCSKFQLT
jgi:hypothetical protein